MLITTNILKFALHASAKSDPRYYLEGVLFTPDRIVATDGHRMAIVRCKTGLDKDTIIPSEAIQSAIKMAGRDKGIDLTAERIGQIAYTPIDAKYPDWARVIPATCSGEKALYHPQLLLESYKALTALAGGRGLGTDRVQLHHNGAGAGIIGHPERDYAFIVIMPMRPGTDKLPSYAWAGCTL